MTCLFLKQFYESIFKMLYQLNSCFRMLKNVFMGGSWFGVRACKADGRPWYNSGPVTRSGLGGERRQFPVRTQWRSRRPWGTKGDLIHYYINRIILLFTVSYVPLGEAPCFIAEMHKSLVTPTMMSNCISRALWWFRECKTYVSCQWQPLHTVMGPKTLLQMMHQKAT